MATATTVEHPPEEPQLLTPINPARTPRLVYTVKEAAAELRIGYSTAREHIRQGTLRSFKIGGRRLVAGEDLLDFIRDLQAEDGGFDD